MGIFSAKAEADPELTALLIAQSDDQRKYGVKIIAKHGVGLRTSLRSGEQILAVFPTDWKLGAITSQRTMIIKGSKVEQELEHSDVRETKIFSNPGKMTVGVFSNSFYLDYRPDDVMRYSAMISLAFDTPREANEACAIVDQIIGT